MRLIDADALVSALNNGRLEEQTGRAVPFNAGVAFALTMVEYAPTIDAVTVVRCKDCKWYGRVDKRRFYRGMDCLQKHIDTIVPDRDFCSKAERRGEQNE